MIGRTNTGGSGGGGGLNFRVFGDTSAPSNPKENDIWVNTDAEVTSWIFSATQPASPSEGMVWIYTGTSSPVAFNALKKNNITVYPTYVKQYISGAWVAKSAKSYHGGAWVEWWTNELYTPGNEWETVTGGWTQTGVKSSSTSSVGAGAHDITRTGEYILVKTAGGSGVVHTAKKINLKNWNTITFNGEFNRGGSADINLLCGCWSSFGTYYSTSYDAATKMTATSKTEITVNVSNLDGEYYVGIGMVAGSSAKITSILLS